MLVIKIEKLKKKYSVTIDDKEYLFLEDTILKYKLMPRHELDLNILNEAISYDKSLEYYEKAVNYQIKYGKCEAEVKRYLLDKGILEDDCDKIINLMEERKILNDDDLIDSLIYSLIKKSNGKALIKEKLYQKGYKKEMIEEHLKLMDMDLYFECLEKLYKKIEHKYDKFNDYIRIQKIKAYLYGRGYSTSEISNLGLK